MPNNNHDSKGKFAKKKVEERPHPKDPIRQPNPTLIDDILNRMRTAELAPDPYEGLRASNAKQAVAEVQNRKNEKQNAQNKKHLESLLLEIKEEAASGKNELRLDVSFQILMKNDFIKNSLLELGYEINLLAKTISW